MLKTILQAAGFEHITKFIGHYRSFFADFQKKVVHLHFEKNTINMDKSRFIICRASAGSGKTYTLVRQYLALAFDADRGHVRDRFRHILAITFTNKAANEMKERILRELESIRQGGTSVSMGRDLAEDTGLDDTTLREYAEIVQQSILHNYTDLSVCTIDSFVQRIVRTYAHDLNLPNNFNVYIDNSELIQNAVDELMGLAGAEGQEELTRMLCEFSEHKMNEGKSFMIENEIAALAQELFKERTPEYLEALKEIQTPRFREIQHEMQQANRAFEKQLKDFGQEGLKIIADTGLNIDDFFHGKTGAGRYFEKLSKGSTDGPNSYVLAYLEEDKLGSAKSSQETLDKLAQAKPPLQELYGRIKAYCDKELPLYNSRTMLLANLYSLAVINKLEEFVARYSEENEIVHISEFNKRISEVVQNEPAPFIYERIGTRYYNYLVDEFQDTSRMQWQNLVPLVENGIASGHTSLVVGDGKQAIYRFRQGDVDQFVALPHVEGHMHGNLLENDEVALATRLENNFRTARKIVEFNNHFFEWAIRNRYADNEELQKIYVGSSKEADLAQNPIKEGGYVQIGFWEPDPSRQIIWKQMLDDIRDQVGSKGYTYRDITLLARDHAILSEISEYLTAEGIPIVSSESFVLTQSTVVMLLRSLLQYLVDGKDRCAAARVLLYLQSLKKVDTDFTSEFADTDSPLDLDAVLQKSGLELRCDKLRAMGLYDCLEEALRMLDLQGIETAYTATMLNVAAKYTSTHRQDLSEFLEWFDEQKGRLSTSTGDDLDAIRLMTIHAAKGLESPIVMYALPNKKDMQDNIWIHIDKDSNIPLPAGIVYPKKDSNTIFNQAITEELQKSDMDRINLLYVALTRPKEKLMIYCQPPKNPGTKEFTSLLQDFLAQCDEAQSIGEGVYAIGENTSSLKSEEPSKAITPHQLEGVVYPDWSNRIAIAEQSKAVFNNIETPAIRRGNQIHELLSLIESSNDVDTALEKYLHLNPTTPEDEGELKTLAHKLMQHESTKQFFLPEYGCKNECNLVWKGEVLRPDRIVFTPEETWVVDFKTGMPKLEHRAQVDNYCAAIREMGYPEVKGYLLYIGENDFSIVKS